jgi:Ca-activated chloride channel family protein
MAAPYSENPRDSITNSRPGPAGGALLAIVLLSGPVWTAQFASGVSAVEVYATVTDQAGQPLTGLTREDFVVRENGQPQQVTTFAEGAFPLAAALALDRSFSMTPARLAAAKSAARAFLGDLRPDDESLILAIGSQVEIVASRSTDRAAQYAALDRLDTFGTTSLHDAIVTALDAIQDAKGRRALILFSDGDDRFSKATAADVVSRVRGTDALVYPIAMGRDRPPLFAELAALSGGRSFHVREPKRLDETLRGIARELRHQYLLGYSPKPASEAGPEKKEEWRSITVTVNRAGARVRARDGYLMK